MKWKNHLDQLKNELEFDMDANIVYKRYNVTWKININNGDLCITKLEIGHRPICLMVYKNVYMIPVKWSLMLWLVFRKFEGKYEEKKIKK